MNLFAPWLTQASTIRRVVQVDRRRIALHALLLGLVFSALMAVPFVFYHRAESENNLRLLQAEQQHIIELADGAIRQEMESVLSDLRYLSQHNELRNYLLQASRSNRLDLAWEYLGLARQKRIYDQIRFIGLTGMEEVRIDLNGGQPVIVADADLQDKHQRYYFEETQWLSPGQIYVSRFDLNMEHGIVSQPHKPAIRFAIPVADDQGLIRGMVVLNYLGQRLRDKLLALQGRAGKIWLVDAEGYWLLGPAAEDEWGFMLPERSQRRLAKLFPQLWQQMETQASGVYQGASSWIRFARVFPLRMEGVSAGEARFAAPVDADRYYWTIAVELSQEAFLAANSALLKKLWTVYGVLVLFAFLVAGALAFVINRNKALGAVTETVLDNLPLLVAYVDKDQRYRFNNMAYELWFGTKPKDIYGKRLPDLLGEAAYRDLQPYVEQVLAGKPVSFERQLPYKGAGLRDVVVSYLPDVSPQGEVRGYYGIIQDVSQTKESERREQQRMAELAHVSRLASMGEMATEIAHEINQPLAAIAMYSTASLRTLRSGGEQGKMEGWLEAINAQAKRASEIIRRIRRFMQKGETQFGPVDLNLIASESDALLAHEARSNQVSVVLDLAEGLPNVQGDRVLLQQVVFNLLRNALDAVRTQPGERRVALSTSFDSQQVTFKASDNGPGVDPAFGEDIFDSFITSKKDGLGMGLTISRTIIEAHAGSLRYTTNPEGGSTFMFSLVREDRQ
ncbi:MAG: PAS domain-containing protein [Thiobacillaceae bacterium]|nr:PAS domain-containing protein [Thiobacillaceae bacterium]